MWPVRANQPAGLSAQTPHRPLTRGEHQPGCRDPGCLPGRRPEEVREERLTGLRYGKSDDGGRLEFDESAPSRRSNSAIRRSCEAIW
jgi:hypothetical protein